MTWSVPVLLDAHAREAPDGIALVEGERVVTWQELHGLVSAARARVEQGGVRPGDRVVLDAATSIDAIAALFGILVAGAVAAPIPAGRTSREAAAALDLVTPVLVLRDGDLYPVDGWTVLEGVGEMRDPEAPAVIVLTSGTTGRPKGVVLSSRALAASAESWLGALPPATGWVLALGIGHVAGLGTLWRAIAGRVPVQIVGPADPAALLAALAAEPGMSHVSLVPAQLARVLDAAGDGPPPSSLRAVLLGGGPIPPALVTRAVGAGWPVVPTYGLSETGSGATALPTAAALDHPGSAGLALPGARVRIDQPDADGVGEIVVETVARFSGYLGDRPSAVPATEPVRTGDLGRLDDAGRLFVVDRRLDRIVRGGENISPSEVEAVLLAHPAIADAAVVGLADPLWGHAPAAAIVLADGATDPGDETLVAHCRASLVGFKVPVSFLRLDVLPRTSGGKLRREAVRGLLAGERAGVLARPDGASIGWRITGQGPLPLLLLHGTLSSARQLDRLAVTLARAGDVTVHALDRRGSGTGRFPPGAAIAWLDLAVHLADIVAYLDARGIARAAVVGVSFGGVLGVELAARHPDRVAVVVAYEPPYGPLADAATRAAFGTLAEATAAAHRTGGPAAAAETFLRAVAGDAAWDRLSERSRASLAQEGDGAAADAALTGARPDDLAAITAPVTILAGGASEAFYGPIGDALAERIPGARRVTLDGLGHPSPITQPSPVAAAIRAALIEAGLVSIEPATGLVSIEPGTGRIAPEPGPVPPSIDPEPPA
jgi:o-succinylbenzoate---CoA ligase